MITTGGKSKEYYEVPVLEYSIIVRFSKYRFPFGFWYLGRGDIQAREYRDGHAATGKYGVT